MSKKGPEYSIGLKTVFGVFVALGLLGFLNACATESPTSPVSQD